MTPESQDIEAKKFIPQPDKASVYVNLDAKTTVPVRVVLDGRIVGALAPKTYVLLNLDQGRHVLNVGLENIDQVTLNAQAGKLYFYRLRIKSGWTSGRIHFALMDEAEGKKRLMKSKRAELTY